MELQGRVIHATEPRSGVSQRGEWKAQDFVIETHESYPRKMVFSVMGEDRLSRFNIQIGQEIQVFFDIDAHEYNGRWFNSIRAYDVRQVDPATIGVQSPPPAQAPGVINAPAAPADSQAPVADATPFPPAPTAEGEAADDLPF